MSFTCPIGPPPTPQGEWTSRFWGWVTKTWFPKYAAAIIPPVAAKGTILVSDGTSWTTLPPGADGLKLTTDSTMTTGLKWV
jgi:hypothetical protein